MHPDERGPEMKVLVAGATGAMGKQLLPRLVEDGHYVVGITRSEAKLALDPRDGRHRRGRRRARSGRRGAGGRAGGAGGDHPPAHRAPTGAFDTRHFDRTFHDDEPPPHRGDGPPAGRRPRRRRQAVHRAELRGLAVRADRRTGQERGRSARPAPPTACASRSTAILHVERAVTGADWTEGIVLRYGGFYGPGTGLSPRGRRQAELLRSGSSRWSATAAASGRSSRSRTRPRPRWPR